MKMPKCWEDILKRVEKPGRYIGGEWNEIKKDPHSVKAKIALVFPDVYEIGMSYLGQKILYSILNQHPLFLAERVFAPWVDFEHELRRQNLPLFSLENKIPLFEFDIIGFSLLYELNYTNILTILDLGRIPLLSSDRNEGAPLVIAGGPASFNPEPVAHVFDFFLIGDGEEAFVEIVEMYLSLRGKALDRRSLLKEMTKIKGVYVPSLYTPFQLSKSSLLAMKASHDVPHRIEKRILFPFDEAPFPEKILVPNVKIIFDRVGVEVQRGCPQKCRFCQAASIYFPPRAKSPSYVIGNAWRSLCVTGYENVSLAALSISDYPYLDEVVKILMGNLEERKISLSLPSLRPKGLTPGITRSIIKVKKTGLTLVPEAGTERLRRVINKNLEDREIIEAAENAFSQGWRLLKLYFMVGLPTETEEDLQGIVAMIEKIIRMGYRILKSAPRINLSISSFIPKPHTPFQWLAMEEEKVLGEKHRFLESRLKKYPFVKFKEHSFNPSLIEAVFSRGDRRLNSVLLEAWMKGARFDSWKDQFRFHTWMEAFEAWNIDYHLYLGAWKEDEILPWEHIDPGIKKSHLWKELEKALRGEPTPSCLETSCGVCQGCFLASLVQKSHHEKVKKLELRSPLLGEKTDLVFRYRACYRKSESARYLSHLDLNHVIQRGFRRTGIPILHSRGFHPKMVISYLPALPLGMEGKRETLEFKSQYLFQEEQFVSHLNTYLPSGVKFLSLKMLDEQVPRLHQDLSNLVYSVDLKAPEIKEALQIKQERKAYSEEEWEIVEERVNDFLGESREGALERANIDRESGRLFLYLRYSAQNGIRPQKIVEDIFGIKNPVFLMAREEALFMSSL